MSYTPPPAPDQPPYGAAPGGTRPGELLDRFLARFIDGIIVGVVYVIVAIVLIFGDHGVTAAVRPSRSFAASSRPSCSDRAPARLLRVHGVRRGQTVGKMVMKLRVVGPGGGNPTFEESIRRNIWIGLPGWHRIVPIIGGLIGAVAQLVAVIMIAVGINNDTVNRQAWHDHFAGETRVLKEG